MKTVNSLSGGKTSSYMAVHYPADYNVFALVTTLDKKCIYPDSKIRQIVSDKISKEFIGTLEEDVIIQTILNLEQHLGTKIDWVSGKSFDEIIVRGDIKYLPNVTQRFCTIEMKLDPINKWWKENINETCEMRFGFRANEMSRAKKMIERCEPYELAKEWVRDHTKRLEMAREWLKRQDPSLFFVDPEENEDDN